MRLSKIKLAGFKSFVDPTTFTLPSSLNGVVGPNGCGKSNIIDAVRWVMGESSAKNLRGDSMADVIFNGSSSRKPVGQASIELVFDNSDGTIGGQYANYNEISVRRTVTRDGQSQYHLNGTRCRRRDITDIFLGTGLGPRSYSIIQQGTISRLIEARPEELRVFLEEAAGISKYKERRRETENRIRHSRDNLDRLNDLREELDKQLAKLERQARTAERYKELKEEERRLAGQLHALRWRVLNDEAHAQEGAIREQETALEAQHARQRGAESAVERLRDEHVDATDAFNRIQSDFYGVGAEIARLEQSLQHARERRQQQARELAQVERAWNDAQSHQAADRGRIEELGGQLLELEPLQGEAQEAAAMAAEALVEAEEAQQAWQTEWDDFNQRAAEPSQTAQVERARMQQLETRVNQLDQRAVRLQQERDNLSGERLEEELGELRERLAEMELGAAERDEALAVAAEAIAARRERNSEDSRELDRLRTELQSRRGRHASLEALQQAALGKGGGAVSEWLRGQGLEAAPRLAQQLTVADGWDKAVETVLGAHLEAVCVPGMDPVLGALGSLQKGSLVLFDSAAACPAATAGAGVALRDQVAGTRPDGLLAGVYCAETLAQALALRAGLAAHESVVTRDGVWLGHGWLRVARDPDQRGGVIQREQELRTLEEELEVLQGQVEEGAERLAQGREQLKALEQERERRQREVTAAGREQAQLQAQLSARQARLEQVQGRRERLAQDLEELAQEKEEAGAEIEAARARLHRALEAIDVLAEQREALGARRDQLRSTIEEQRRRARGERDRAHELTVRIQTLRTELDSTAQALERMERQLGQLAEQREELLLAQEQGEEPLQLMAEQLDEQLNRRMEVEERLGEARKRVGDIDHEMRRQDGERVKAEREAEQVRDRLEKLRLALQETQVRRQTVQERLSEGGHELRTLLTEIQPEAEIAILEQQVEAIGVRIGRLGAINLAAIDEYQQQAERKAYLDAQNADLMEALETLENAIRKIDRETRTRFKETFDQVNSGLQEKFPRLFGGGHAYLELTGEDLLDTGVTVMARPPGKRNSTIHLLSGGEKALTAVALVFAIFELNPSPFCMLDEVDAPLDEANVGRFCKLVREMSERVQFIFITHNKTTMELADHLAGVTMHEPGVSRLVAVDVDAAVELAAV